MRLPKAIMLASVLATCPGAAYGAIRQPEPQQLGTGGGTQTLGGWLEQRLQDMVKNCTGSSLKMKYWRTQDVSAIPNILYTDLRISSHPLIQVLDGASVTHRFGTVFTGQDHAISTDIAGLDYANTNDMSTEPGLNSVTYNNTCASVLNAAVDANAGYSLPVASIQAALKADYEGSNSYALNLVSGTFLSPIPRSLRHETPIAGETLLPPLQTALILWAWYRQNPDKIGQINQIISRFTGQALYHWSGLKQKTKVEGSVSGNVTFPGITFKAQTSASVNNAVSIDAASFEVAMDPATIKYATLPNPDALALMAKESGEFTLGTNSSDTVLFNRDTKIFFEQTKNISLEYCQMNLWQSDSALVSLANVAYDSAKAACTFELHYTPTSADADILLRPAVQQTIATGSKDYVLKLSTPPIALTARKEPYLIFNSGLGTPTFQLVSAGPPTTSNLIWTYRYTLTTTGNQVSDATKINFSQVSLSCPSNQAVQAQPLFTASLQQGGDNRVMTITLTAQYDGDAPGTGAPLEYAECTLTGNVAFLLGNAKVERALPTPHSLLYPTGRHLAPPK
ncbi:MAG: hypothetical protein JWR80_6149 [Bradyrhizobium sp.]|nr:hypothetical protein [Bradyrhizobium sp.]